MKSNGTHPQTHSNKDQTSQSLDENYWENNTQSEILKEDYAHNIRSSSFQVLHSQHAHQGSAGLHCRNPSSISNYSDTEEFSTYSESSFSVKYNSNASLQDSNVFRATSSGNWFEPEHNYREQNYNYTDPYPIQSSLSTYPNMVDDGSVGRSSMQQPYSLSHDGSKISPSYSSHQNKLDPSPPPPPVRDASSLKYIKYGPGHEKFPSWPIHAGSNVAPLAGSSDTIQSQSSLLPQGSHRSKSWTEQSEFPKDSSGDYARPQHKRQFTPAYTAQLNTVMEKTERIPPHIFEPGYSENRMFRESMKNSERCNYPPFDKDGRPVDDKDYMIPSPPERDSSMNFSKKISPDQLEEYARKFDTGITPFLDRLRQESATWDMESEKDSGRGESEAMTDSILFSNGRESVTTVVTNSSASSSETLKGHGSLSDLSFSGSNYGERRPGQNVVHSARIRAPQRYQSESILYYDKSRKQAKSNLENMSRNGSETNINYDNPNNSRLMVPNGREYVYDSEKSEKFFHSGYSQAPVVASENMETKSMKNTKRTEKPLSVAERIHLLERQSNNDQKENFMNSSNSVTERKNSFSSNKERFLQRAESAEVISDSEMIRLEYNNEEKSKLNNKISPMFDNSVQESQCEQSNHNVVRKPLSRNSFSRSKSQSDNVTSYPDESIKDQAHGLKNFSYLDPRKQCKVPDETLKNIQKQALLSFVERKTSVGNGRARMPSSGTGDNLSSCSSMPYMPNPVNTSTAPANTPEHNGNRVPSKHTTLPFSKSEHVKRLNESRTGVKQTDSEERPRNENKLKQIEVS